MSALAMLLLVALGCAPPEPFDLSSGTDVVEPFIEIVYPEGGQVVELNDNCEFDEIIVVYIDGLELVPPGPDVPAVEGQGHWHGGISDLDSGFCLSSRSWCDDYQPRTFRDGSSHSVLATLVTNEHEEFGDVSRAEVQLVAPAGVTCE